MQPAAPGKSMHVRVWEFLVREGFEAAFEETYGPRGAWARLFARGKGWLGTELLRVTAIPRRFVVIDRWASAGAFARFRESHGDAYESLDRECEAWTEKEVPIGAFEVPVD